MSSTNPNLFSAVTRRLAIFAVINCVMVNLVLQLCHSTPTALNYAFDFCRFHTQLRDSWDPMRMALERLEQPQPGEGSFYDAIFFQKGVKFQYPPTALLMIESLKRYGLGGDRALNLISWMALAIAAIVTARIFDVRRRVYPAQVQPGTDLDKIAVAVLIILLGITFYPWTRSFWLGQIQSWIDLFFALALLAWIRNQKDASGCLMGLICVIKPQMGLMLLWGLLRRQWRFAAGFGGTVALFAGVSFLRYGWSNHAAYLRVLSAIGRVGEAYYPNQSFNGLLHRLLHDTDNLEWSRFSFPAYNPWIFAGTIATSAIMIALALFWRSRQHRDAQVTDFCIAALTFTMAAPIAWEHHYGIVLPIIAALLPGMVAAAPRFSRRDFFMLAVSFMLVSNLYTFTNNLSATTFNFGQSYLFFGALALLGLMYRLMGVESEFPALRAGRADGLEQATGDLDKET